MANLTGSDIEKFLQNFTTTVGKMTNNLNLISESCLHALATSTLGTTNSSMHDLYVAVGNVTAAYKENLINMSNKMSSDVNQRKEKLTASNATQAGNINKINSAVDSLSEKANSYANKYNG